MTIGEKQKLFRLFSDLKRNQEIIKKGGDDIQKLIISARIDVINQVLQILRLEKDFIKFYHNLGDIYD